MMITEDVVFFVLFVSCHNIVLILFRLLNKDCQMLLFSATFEESVWKFAEQVVPDPNIIRLKREEETLDTIKQFYVVCKEKEDKFTALCNLYGSLTIAQAMIFCHVSRVTVAATTVLLQTFVSPRR